MLTRLAIPILAAILAGLAFGAAPADAMPRANTQLAMAATPELPFRLAQSGCGHAVAAVRAQTGISGRLVGVERSGGRVVCVVLILRPNAGGNRPPTPTKIRVPAR
jgi:hypothetical protein